MTMLLVLLLGMGSHSAEQAGDPCALISDSELRAVQGQMPVEKVRSEQRSGAFRLIQCFYRTADSTSSVSLALAVPSASEGTGSGPRDYWKQRFHAPPAPPGRTRKEPPQPQEDLGEEAFWVGDPMTGALYVLEDTVFLRVSPGGSVEASVKRDRARALAGHVLERLRGVTADAPRPAVSTQ